MDIYYDGCYRFVRMNMSRVGLWPYDDPNFRKFRRNFFMFVISASFFLQVAGFLLLPFNLRLLYKFIIRISPTVFAGLVYIWLICNERELKNLFDKIRINCRSRSTKEMKLVQTYVNHEKHYVDVFIYSCIIVIISNIVPDILLALKSPTMLNETRVRKFPISVGYFEEFQSYYFVILIPLYVILLTEMVVSVGTWNTYIHFVYHICAMFRVARDMVENVFSDKRVKFKVDKNKTRNALVRVINYHNDCIRFLNDINVICENIFLFQLLITCIVISVDVLYLADVKYFTKDYKDLIVCTMYIFCHLFLLCSSCHFGQNVMDHGVNFYKKIYTVPWYVTPVRTQKMCLLIMTKSAKPLYLSIGKVFVLSYELLVTVLNTSISYAMVFRSV